VLRAERGMTLIEILISLTLLSIVSLALIQAALVAINVNVRNELRDEAVSVAEKRLNELRNTPFSDPAMQVNSPGGATDSTVTRNIRSAAILFTIKRVITQVTTDNHNRQVTLTVTWSYKGVTAPSHTVSTVLSDL
jgi:prepilin-type N-terminal cleavage/methylation domain-containing protein